MKKYIAVSATRNKVIENWGGTSVFTDEALTQLAETVSGKLVLDNFDQEKPVGKVVSGKNDDGKLTIIVEIDDNFIIWDKHRIVPGFIVNQDNWDESGKDVHRTIRDVESGNYGLTDQPAEQDLPEIKEV